ncbi:MAG: biopolymer transporter ExbD [Planctomycetota bacterium]
MTPARSHVGVFDLTPMIDVVLLLIIFFLVTSQFSRSIRAPMDLPEQAGRAGERAGDSGAVVVDLLADGGLRVEAEQVSPEVFSSMVRSAVRDSGNGVEVLIRADRSARVEHLNALADRLIESGVTSYRIATRPGSGGTP